jgi:hypothetical protein
MKYIIETGIETKTSLSTVKTYDNAKELREYINSLDSTVWYVVEYADTKQRIVQRNYGCEGTKYNDGIECPKSLLGL